MQELEFESKHSIELPTTWGAKHKFCNPFIKWPSDGLSALKLKLRNSSQSNVERTLTSDTLSKSSIDNTICYIKKLNSELEFSLKLMLDIRTSKRIELDYKVQLPPLESLKKTLILDLDDTLIKTIKEDDCKNLTEEMKTNLKFANIGKESIVFFLPRPHLTEFLEALSQFYELIVFSAGTEEYVNTIVNIIDPDCKYISTILTRAHCIKVNTSLYIKDLTILDDRNLKNMIIIDNMAFSFSYQIENGIYIPSFTGESDDSELPKLKEFLLSIKDEDDIRPAVEKFSRISYFFKRMKVNKDNFKEYANCLI